MQPISLAVGTKYPTEGLISSRLVVRCAVTIKTNSDVYFKTGTFKFECCTNYNSWLVSNKVLITLSPLLTCVFPTLFVYLCEAHELVDVLGQKYNIAVWRYHGDEALQRLQVQAVHLSVLIAVTAAAPTAWRRETRWNKQTVSVNLGWLLNYIIIGVCMNVCVFHREALAHGQNKLVQLLSCNPGPLLIPSPDKLHPKRAKAFITAPLKDITQCMCSNTNTI